MPKLTLVADTPRPADTAAPDSRGPDGTAEKMSCVLTYLRSLEKSAEALHGDNEDWRYGRYLVLSAISEILQRSDRQDG